MRIIQFHSILFYKTEIRLFIFHSRDRNCEFSYFIFSHSRLLAIPVHFGDKLSDGTIRIINTFYVCNQLHTLYLPPLNLHRSKMLSIQT
jgi:hypothetical protein